MSRSVIAVLSFSILTFGSPLARANFGSYPGGWNSEPTGLEKIRITSEQLTIDLRGCDGSEVADRGMLKEDQNPIGRVEAIYNLRNDGLEREVHLIFAAGNDIKSDAIQVFMNDLPVQATQTLVDKPQWHLPSQTPGIDGHDGRPFIPAETATNFSVHLKIPAGSNILRVHFRTLIGRDLSTVPICCWQFIYLLAPALDWGGFDKLDVKVLIPPRWKGASNIALQREGDILSGTFDRIPDDALALTIRMAPEPMQEHIELVKLLTWIVVGVSVPLILFATWRIGRKIGSRAGKIQLVLASGLAWGTTACLAGRFLLVYPVEMHGVPPLQKGVYGWAFPPKDVMWLLVLVITFFTALGGAALTELILKSTTKPYAPAN